jgi:dynein heavy chain
MVTTFTLASEQLSS